MSKTLTIFDRQYLNLKPKVNPWGLNFLEDEFAAQELATLEEGKLLSMQVARAKSPTALIYEEYTQPLVKRIDVVEAKAVALAEEFMFDYICIATSPNQALLIEGLYKSFLVDSRQLQKYSLNINPPNLGLVEIILKKYHYTKALLYADKGKFRLREGSAIAICSIGGND